MKGQAWPGGHKVQEVAFPEEKVPWKERESCKRVTTISTGQHKVINSLGQHKVINSLHTEGGRYSG